ncbi:unnamed protein product [Microthlaspi erraticum]|uniref:F-box domain-containing protein n=1 Tax=Microthlaspi erraticum TaxID=1685480 RepID=A0A6D2JN04_9BRAS|nr:unnamed protein product [Microthlaspi erraticum]
MSPGESSEPRSLIMSLPEDVIVDIIARVPRFDYPTLSLVSKHFRSLVASSELYARRSLLECAEHCLYVFIYCRWYILCRKPDGNHRLVLISSLPALHGTESFVVVGSRIYVIGGGIPSSAFSIDCISHTVQNLPSMPTRMTHTVAGVIDGKVYVTGYDVHDRERSWWRLIQKHKCGNQI